MSDMTRASFGEDRADGDRRRPAWLPAAAGTLILTIAVAIALMPGELFVKTLVIDDALFYSAIARGIAQGQGSTFDDGLTHTNGYHPLWCWLQVPVAFIWGGGDPMIHIWWVKLLAVITILLMFWVWYRLVAPVLVDSVATAVFLLLLGGYWWSVSVLYGLMETPLVLLFVGLSLLWARRFASNPSAGHRHAAVLGFLMAGALLARLDSVFFVGLLALWLAVQVGRRRRPLVLGTALATAAACVLPYLIWNLVNFGNIVPVSGLRKTSALDLAARLSTLGDFWTGKWIKVVQLLHPVGLALLALGLVVVLWIFGRELVRTMGRTWGLLWLLPAAACAHAAYITLFMTEGNVQWYHYLEYASLYLLVATGGGVISSWCLRRGLRRLRYLPPLIVGLLIVLLLAAYVPANMSVSGRSVIYDMAEWARDNLEPDSRCGMYDPGIFRVVSGLSTLGLNGLVGDQELLEIARSRSVNRAIDRYGLNYIVTFAHVRALADVDPGEIAYASPEIVKLGIGTCRYVILEASAYGGAGVKLPAR